MLYLLPNLLNEEGKIEDVLPQTALDAASQMDGLFAENLKEGRRFLSHIKLSNDRKIADIPMEQICLETTKAQMEKLLEPLLVGKVWGLVSDAGLPCIADPGSLLVKLAKERGIPVKTFVGPCSFLLALQLSGLPGQSFSFHGYLSRDSAEFTKQIKALEAESKARKMTQLFMETPYRNIKTFELLLKTLHPETELSIAIDLTGKEEFVQTKTVASWRKSEQPFKSKLPAVFTFCATRPF